MRGCDEAEVDALGLRRADRHDLALLNGTQQLGLHAGGELADFVEEDGAAFGRAEEAGLVAHRAGERAAVVAEELGFGEGLGERRAVHGDERAGALGARVHEA